MLEDDIPPDKSIVISSEVKHLMQRTPPDKTNSTSYDSCAGSTSLIQTNVDIHKTSCDSNGITTRADVLVPLGIEPSRITSSLSIQKQRMIEFGVPPDRSLYQLLRFHPLKREYHPTMT